MDLGVIEQTGARILEGVIGGGLAAIGIPERIASVAAKCAILAVTWGAKAALQGRDAAAELDAMLNAADVVVDAAEREKFGG